jgi:hypothetical protein
MTPQAMKKSRKGEELMKAWEMVEGKTYIATNSDKYKMKNGELWWVLMNSRSNMKFNEALRLDFKEVKELVSWDVARKHMEDGGEAKFEDGVYIIRDKGLFIEMISIDDYDSHFIKVYFRIEYLDRKWELL